MFDSLFDQPKEKFFYQGRAGDDYFTGQFVYSNEHQPDFIFSDVDERVSFDNGNSFFAFSGETELVDLCRINRYHKRDLKFKNKFLNIDENRINSDIYWKIYKMCSELFSYHGKSKDFISHFFKLPEIRKLLDVKIVNHSLLESMPVDEDLAIFVDDHVVLISSEEEIDISLMRAFYDFYNEVKDCENETAKIGGLVKKILNILPFPVVILNNNDQIVHLNESYLNLNIRPKEVIEHRKGQWIIHNEKKIKILSKDLDSGRTVYLLVEQTQAERPSLDSKSELGIISGSIAHELNNPVGGILAALSLIELENWEQENVKTINDMRQSALRCKSLIETFLGFSRYETKIQDLKKLSTIVEQATSLLRYRVVESGLNFEIDIDNEIENFQTSSSILTMALYLIFSELMTIVLHRQLIDPSLKKNISVKLHRKSDRLVLKVSTLTLTPNEKDVFNSKLLQHLLEMNRMKIIVESDEIYLKGFFDGRSS